MQRWRFCSELFDRIFWEIWHRFFVVRIFQGAPVHGYILKKEDGTYQIVLTIRGSYADIFWFSLFHELGHIVNGDATGTIKFIDYNENAEEVEANEFASSSLIDLGAYKNFVEQKDFSLDVIKRFALDQNVRLYIVIGRLQHDKLLTFNRYSS